MTQHQSMLGWVEREARRDYMPKYARGGEGISVIGVVLVILFFYAHQAWSTGFFTDSFGPLEAFLLYGSIILGALGPLARGASGRRNVSRPPEMLASMFWIIASAWLLLVFPFDFAHFAGVIPDFFRFMVTWITNDIATILIIIGTAGGLLFIGIDALLYVKVRALLQKKGGL